MRHRTKPELALMKSAGYSEPRERVGCHSCRFSQPEPSNARIRCTRSKPMFMVKKLGICAFHERAGG